MLALLTLGEVCACSSSDARAAPDGLAEKTLTSKPTSPKPQPASPPKAPQAAPPAAATAPAAPNTSEPPQADRAPAPGQAREQAWTVDALLALPGSHSTSIGSPSAGKVKGAVPVPDEGPGFYHNPKRPDGARFGTVELVQLIMRAAAGVQAAIPGSLLTINDLGLREGGPIQQHGSHQAGRDADILFYSLDAHDQPIRSVGVPIDPNGEGVDFKDLADPSDDQPIKLDARRTWRFMAELIEAAGDNLQRIFIVEHVRRMLLAQARRVHAPKHIIERFADITCQPGTPHDDHMHIRLFCTPQDMAAGCLDKPPNYPFRLAQLAALGLTPLMASNKVSAEERRARAARTTTPEQARERAGPMHADVVAFLEQREAWVKRPSPGRRYCR